MSLTLDIILAIFIVLLAGLTLILLLTFIMHFLMPRNVLKTYFKEPYFRPGEIAMLTGFPFGYIRTSMLMGILGFPASGKKRGLENAYKLAPVWYCTLSKYITVFFVIGFSLFILITAILSVYMLIYE
ncbi:hypothetical protein MNBD_GAMMA19-1683 [hydrothermal vent metagenome]|uniref:Uncharacterized protein n=1 Tax=hydrothermal vent metagenome TaxID=652676 RepID=A0A3B1ACN7_9ZZZZ